MNLPQDSSDRLSAQLRAGARELIHQAPPGLHAGIMARLQEDKEAEDKETGERFDSPQGETAAERPAVQNPGRRNPKRLPLTLAAAAAMLLALFLLISQDEETTSTVAHVTEETTEQNDPKRRAAKQSATSQASELAPGDSLAGDSQTTSQSLQREPSLKPPFPTPPFIGALEASLIAWNWMQPILEIPERLDSQLEEEARNLFLDTSRAAKCVVLVLPSPLRKPLQNP